MSHPYPKRKKGPRGLIQEIIPSGRVTLQSDCLCRLLHSLDRVIDQFVQRDLEHPRSLLNDRPVDAGGKSLVFPLILHGFHLNIQDALRGTDQGRRHDESRQLIDGIQELFQIRLGRDVASRFPIRGRRPPGYTPPATHVPEGSPLS